MDWSMNTNVKIAIARSLSHVARLVKGSSKDQLVCKRSGLNWEIDLLEGIDLSIFLFGKFERKTLNVIEALLKPNSIVIDIGANVGALSLPIAQMLGDEGKVVSVEPTDWAFAKLNRNFGLNPSLKKRSITVNAKIGCDESILPKSFFSSWNLESKEGVHESHKGSLHSAADASFYTLENLVTSLSLPKVDLIKLDVDGYETQILKGGASVFRKFKPALIVEICPYVLRETGTSTSELISILAEYGYSKIEDMSGKKIPFDANHLESIIPERGGTNFLIKA